MWIISAIANIYHWYDIGVIRREDDDDDEKMYPFSNWLRFADLLPDSQILF